MVTSYGRPRCHRRFNSKASPSFRYPALCIATKGHGLVLKFAATARPHRNKPRARKPVSRTSYSPAPTRRCTQYAKVPIPVAEKYGRSDDMPTRALVLTRKPRCARPMATGGVDPSVSVWKANNDNFGVIPPGDHPTPANLVKSCPEQVKKSVWPARVAVKRMR